MPLGIIKNLKIHIGGLSFKITVTIFKMKNQDNSYSMLLGRPWLKQARGKHDWGKKHLTLYQDGIDVYIGTNWRWRLPDSSRSINIEGFDWESRLTNEEKQLVYQAYASLHHIADMELDGLKQLYETDCNMVMTNIEGENMENINATTTLKEEPKTNVKKKGKQVPKLKEGTPKQKEDMNEIPIYPFHFYEMKEGEQAIDQTPTSKAVQGKTIAGWTIEDEDMIKEINFGTMKDPKMVRIGKELDPTYEEQVIEILRDYKNVFVWTYEDMKGIPPHICEHKIELKPHTKPIMQSRYRMNPNYAAKVKEEIDKLLKVRLIYPVDRAEWLSPIVIVPKKNEKLKVV